MVADRTYASQEALAQTTMTSSTFASKLSKTIVSADLASSTWCLFASGQHSVTTGPASGVSQIRVRNDTDSTTLVDVADGNASTSYTTPIGLFVPATFGAAPGDKTFKIEQASSDNTQTVSSANLRFFGIKLRGNDTVQTAAGPFNPTGATPTYNTILTWTAPANDTYEVLFGVRCVTASAGLLPRAAVFDTNGTTILRELGTGSIIQTATNAVWNPCWAVTRTMTAGQTLTLGISRGNGANANFTFTNAVAVGFAAAEWPQRQVANDDTSQTFVASSSTTWSERPGSLAASVDDVAEYFAWMNWNMSFDSSGGIGVRSNTQIDGTVLATTAGAGNSGHGGGFVMGRVLTPRSPTFAVEQIMGTNSGNSFPVDSTGALSVAWRLKAGTGAPAYTPRATRLRPPPRRQWKQTVGIWQG